MAFTTPIGKKTNLNPRQTILTDGNGIDNKDHMFPFYLLIMMPNTIGSLFRAYHHNDYSFAVPFLLFFTSILLLECCLSRYLSMPRTEKPGWHFLLKLTTWFLYTAIWFGFVYQFAQFLTLQITVALYTLVFVFSLFLLYAFIIIDLVSYWKSRSSGEDENGAHEKLKLNAGESNYANSVLEKV